MQVSVEEDHGKDMYMDKQIIKQELVKFKGLVQVAREGGLTDAEIIAVLGLNPKRLGEMTRRILRAIQQGEVEPDARDIAEKVLGGKDKYRNAHYHLTKLTEAGYLYEK